MATRAITILLIVFLSMGCGGEDVERAPSETGKAIVRVGEVVLTEEALENLLPEADRVPFTMQEKRLYVRRWVETEMFYQEALRRGLKDDPRVRARLKSLEQEFLADHLTFLELRERTVVSEEEIEAYFAAHEREYLYEYRVRHILVGTYEEAEEVLELLERNSFPWVANRYSIDPVAKRGGDLGYLTKGNMIPEFEEVIFDMEPGAVSGIVKSDFGYHIIMLVGMRESLVEVHYADVREQIMNMLLIDKREKAYEELKASLMRSSDIEYYDTSYEAGSAEETGITGPDSTERNESEEGEGRS
jgi:peptidyl-prolyl cis-trans isomerase C